MKKDGTIYTLNARDNVVLDLCYKDSSPKEIYEEINNVFDMFTNSLESSNIEYKTLKNSLIPSNRKNEVVLIFDVLKSGFLLMTIISFQKYFLSLKSKVHIVF